MTIGKFKVEIDASKNSIGNIINLWSKLGLRDDEQQNKIRNAIKDVLNALMNEGEEQLKIETKKRREEVVISNC